MSDDIDSMPTGFSSGGTCTLLPSFLGGTSKFLGVQSLTLHLGVQRKLTAVCVCIYIYSKH